MSIIVPLAIWGSRGVIDGTKKNTVILNLMIKFVLGRASAKKKLNLECSKYITHENSVGLLRTII